MVAEGASGLELSVGVVVRALVALAIAYVVARVSTAALRVASERFVEHRITIRMFVPVVKFLAYAVAAAYIVGPLLQLTSAQLLAVSGLLGAAIGFGLQDLFANLVGGVVLLVEKPYQVGDKVTLGEHYGEVTDISLRATKVRTPDDSTVSVPNYQFVTDAVVNANSGNPEMLVAVEVHVADDADLDRATRIVEDALVTSRYVYVAENRPYTVLVEDTPYYRTLRAKAYVNDIRNEPAFRSDVTERVLRAFEAADISRPSPHRLATDGDD